MSIRIITPRAGGTHEEIAILKLRAQQAWSVFSELQMREGSSNELRDEAQDKYAQAASDLFMAEPVPAVAECVCGAEIVLSNKLLNGCDNCHRWYDIDGEESAAMSEFYYPLGEQS